MDDPKIISAMIAGFISLLVSLGTMAYARRRLQFDKQRFEQETVRKATERLYEMRLEAYPKAYRITFPLLGHVLEDTGLTHTILQSVHSELVAWASSEASFILSRKSRRAFHELREQLERLIKLDDPNTDSEIAIIREKRGHFRRNLRRDVHLLFLEDERFPEDGV